jgi:cobalt/nickel transport system permease protein
MLNIPIPPLPTSGHLMGAVLAAIVLGPWAGLLVLTVVLSVQCLLFQDGGLTTLGANIFNVGVIGCVVGYAVFSPIRRALGGFRGTVVGAVIAAWFSVFLGATACAFELALSGMELAPTLGIMLLAHSLIGIGEALITGLVVAFVLRTRPDLIHAPNETSGLLARSGQVVVAGLAVALVLSVLLSPVASELPDGLEWTLEKLGAQPKQPFAAAYKIAERIPMPDYQVPWMQNLRLAGSVAGAVGTIVVFGAAYWLARGFSSKSSIAHTPHAS